MQIGARLGAYEVIAKLGEGGMGEVYKARDTRLDRTVAIKVLPESLASDPQFRERFEREARVISQLDHPNICTLYDVGDEQGTAYLVMQYLEGETLADRLARGRLPLDQVVKIAGQIADALDRAHRAGIVHRDLKPGNIMLTRGGAASTSAQQVSLVDFGLAKTSGPVASANLSMLPTTPPGLTAQGTILGTFQYMAPEQLEGQEADARTDIFAFGAVVYEMVTGKKAFEGKSQASLIAAILERQPPLLGVAEPSASSALEHVVLRCLAKDPADRWQSARDVGHELRWATERQPTQSAATGSPSRSLTAWVAWPLAIVALLAAAIIGALHWFEPRLEQRTVRFEVHAPQGTAFSAGTQLRRMALSPDGTKLAVVVSPGGNKPNQLYVRRLDSVEATVLAGTEEASEPFWSPDGRFVAFFAGGKLKKIDVTGGLPQTVCDAAGFTGQTTGGFAPPTGTWNRDGVILFSARDGLRRVAAAGGEPAQVTTIDESQGVLRHVHPRFLPDGRRFLFVRTSIPLDTSEIVVGSLDSPSVTAPILKTNYQAEFALPDRLLFVRDGVLYAQRFDLDALSLRDAPVTVADRVSILGVTSTAAFSVAENGVLVFQPAPGSAVGSDLELRLFERSGKEIGRAGGEAAYRGLDLSPDGIRVASHRHADRGGDIWLTDMRSGNSSRFTFEPTHHNVSPIWSPDGAEIAFAALRNGSWGLYKKAADGVGAEERLFESPSLILPLDWSQDRQTILFLLVDPKTATDLWRLPLTGERKPLPFLQDPYASTHAQLSPDGHWVTYTSNESGTSQVYVLSFPTSGTRYQLTTDGGSFPRWRDDGNEILYMSLGDRRLMSVMVQPTGKGLTFSAPASLFDSQYVNFPHVEVSGGGPYHTFAVSHDGQRFVVPVGRRVAEGDANSLVVVLNWASALER